MTRVKHEHVWHILPPFAIFSKGGTILHIVRLLALSFPMTPKHSLAVPSRTRDIATKSKIWAISGLTVIIKVVKYIVYILQSAVNGSYYIGYTHDINKRIIFHNSGKVRSTKSFFFY